MMKLQQAKELADTEVPSEDFAESGMLKHEGLSLLRDIAIKGHIDAMYQYGVSDKTDPLAIHFIEAAARQGKVEAQITLGRLIQEDASVYRRQVRSRKKQDAEDMKPETWFKKAYETNPERAAELLSAEELNLIEQSEEKEKVLSEANAEKIESAAKRGKFKALIEFGRLLKEGNAIRDRQAIEDRDPVIWFRKAADKNFVRTIQLLDDDELRLLRNTYDKHEETVTEISEELVRREIRWKFGG